MANSDTPFGFKPARKLGAMNTTGGVNRYYRGTGDANNLFIGDPVDLGGTGDTAGVPSVVRATAGSGGYAVGVVVGIENNTSDNLGRTYLPASTAGYVLVCDDPDEVFIIQEDSTSGALAVTDIGLNADFVIGSGNTTTGISATELQTSSINTTNTLQLRVLGLYPDQKNEVGTNAKWLVRFNLHRARYTTGA